MQVMAKAAAKTKKVALKNLNAAKTKRIVLNLVKKVALRNLS